MPLTHALFRSQQQIHSLEIHINVVELKKKKEWKGKTNTVVTFRQGERDATGEGHTKSRVSKVVNTGVQIIFLNYAFVFHALPWMTYLTKFF